jgi:protein-L-isoaspartate(D-aspartate) O-methyltransferase
MSIDYFEERQEMVAAIRTIAQHLATEIGKPTLDERVLSAMAKVPRQEFVPVEVKPYAYLNRPLPIGFDKTISQPLIVAVMTDLLVGQTSSAGYPSESPSTKRSAGLRRTGASHSHRSSADIDR